jgi:hypothetical protein
LVSTTSAVAATIPGIVAAPSATRAAAVSAAASPIIGDSDMIDSILDAIDAADGVGASSPVVPQSLLLTLDTRQNINGEPWLAFHATEQPH